MKPDCSNSFQKVQNLSFQRPLGKTFAPSLFLFLCVHRLAITVLPSTTSKLFSVHCFFSGTPARTSSPILEFHLLYKFHIHKHANVFSKTSSGKKSSAFVATHSHCGKLPACFWPSHLCTAPTIHISRRFVALLSQAMVIAIECVEW